MGARPVPPLLVFLHIPKTAGTTMRRILARQYGPAAVRILDESRDPQAVRRFADLPEREGLRVRAVAGHMGYGLHELVARPVRYLVFLRDPVERIVSHYYYVMRTPDHRFHDDANALGLGDFVRKLPESELVNDGQVKWLTREAVTGRSLAGDADPLEVASRHLSTAVVGLAERFDESLLLMQSDLRWKTPYYVKENVTRDRPRGAALSADDRRTIEEANARDLELYREAARAFDDRVARRGEAFPAHVRRFRARNRRYGWLPGVADRYARAASSAVSRLRRPRP